MRTCLSSCLFFNDASRPFLIAAARLVFRLHRYDHVSDVLAIKHWLRLQERVNFKLALVAYRVQHDMAPVSPVGLYLNQFVPA